MDRPWQAEVAISPSEALHAINAQFGELAARFGEELPAGWDNSVFRVETSEGDFIFRFPRRQIAAPLIRRESRVLGSLAEHGGLSLAIPQPSHFGAPSTEYPWPFVGYPLIAGDTADRAALDEGERSACAAPLGRFLAALHAFSEEEARGLGAEDDTFDRLNVSRLREIIGERLAHLGKRGIGGDLADLARMAQEQPGAMTTARPRSRSLCHGDLYARHLLIDERRALAAIIDWGDVHIGDPATDLSIAFSFFGAPERARFLACYGPVTDEALSLARFRALMYAVTMSAFGDDTKDDALLAEGCRALENLKENRG